MTAPLTSAERAALRAEVDEAIARSQPRSEECDGYGGELPNSADGWFCDKCAYVGRWGQVGPHDYEPPAPNVRVPASTILSLLDENEELRTRLANLVAETGIPEGGECAACCAPFSWDGINHDEGCAWVAARAVLQEAPKPAPKERTNG